MTIWYNDTGVFGSASVTDGSKVPTIAFYLDLSFVIFTSASGAGKSASFAAVGMGNTSANTWKLTLKGTDTTLNASKTAGNTTLQEGYTAPTEALTISHSAATALTDATQVSAMLTSSDGTVLYYGKINDDTAATSSLVTIPTGLTEGSYSLYVFAEDVNTGNETDYATPLGTAIPITISAAQSTYQVTVNGGTGAGSFTEGAPVTITANPAPSGQEFDKWVVVSGITLTSSTDASTTFNMPGNAVEITATYKAVATPPSDPTPSTPDTSTSTPDTSASTPAIQVYTITDTPSAPHVAGANGTLTMTCSGALADLTGIYVDNVLVGADKYELVSGSTILTLKADYLNSLSVGTHTLKFAYTSGSAETTFQVSTKATKDGVPKTGDSTPIIWLLALILASGAGVYYFGNKRKHTR